VDKLDEMKAPQADPFDAALNGLAPRSAPDFSLTDRPAGERIVAAARELFCRDGIHATGIDRILAAASASKMALYSRFGSKEALVREVLQREGAEWRASFFAEVMRAGHDPMSRLMGVVDALEAWFRGGRFYGCSFMNASAEHSKGEPTLRALAAEHHREVLGFLEAIAIEAGLHAPRMIARQILLTMEGTIASLMVAGDGDVLTIARANLQSILRSTALISK
jgi:AcrR family transcriptional regulator